MTVVEVLILASLLAFVVAIVRRHHRDGHWLLGISFVALVVLLSMFGNEIVRDLM